MRILKKTLCFLILIIGLAQSVNGQDFYDIGTINTIEISFVESNWDQILDDLYAAGDEDRHIGTVIINGVQYDSVGVRYKGNSTYNPNQIKNPLNIKLDHIIDDQDLNGYGTLKLANVTNDPSFVREVLGYEIARQYMPASEANFANVYINGELMGLYSNVQSVDKFFMGTHFNSTENARFKGELTGDRPTLVDIWNYRGADSTAYYDYYELKSDYGWAELLNFLDIFNNQPEDIEDVLNVDQHLWMLAYDVLMVNLDAPVNFAHNYYLYQEDNGRFAPIIWDLNENFGVFSQLLSGERVNNLSELDPFLNAAHPSFPIISKVLSDPTYKKMYVAHMKTMIEEIFSSQWYADRILEIQDIIDADVQADPNKFYTYNDFLSNVDNTIGSGGPPGPGNRAIVGITELMNARVTYIGSLPEFQATAPGIAHIANASNHTAQYSEAVITAEVSDANSVMLAYRASAQDAFTQVEMLDDGNSEDGVANDGIYGATIEIQASDVQYYIYAENDEAGAFSPVRAAHEYYVLEVVTGDLVINEFMADNDAIVSDQDGEYDDWIELYNNTSEPISLAGYFLSDDGSDLTQWAFPDTSIAANGYLIIWADNDTLQAGLHTNFGLSRNGDSIYLTEPDTTVIADEIAFGAQETDMSFGRFPNGTGDFVEMTPSYATMNNSVGVSIVDELENPNQFLVRQNYPNPFKSSTTIEIALSDASEVSLDVFNLLGQKIHTLVSGYVPAGNHQYEWQPAELASGLYFYTLTAGSFSETKKMFLLK